MHRIAAFVIAFAISAPSWAAAEPEPDLLTNGYFGFNGGRADYRWTNPPGPVVHDLCDSTAFECSTWAGAWKLYGGYMFSRFFGVEVLGFRLGEVGQKFNLPSGVVVKQEIQIKGYGLAAVGELPLGRFAVQGRAGYAGVTAVRTDKFVGVGTIRDEKSRTEPIFGAGVSLRVWQGLRLRVDWDRVRARTEAGEKFEVDFLSAGAAYRF